MFKKILIANRGVFALRVLRTCKNMGIPTVVVHSSADSESMPVVLADESVCIGGPKSRDSYLNKVSIIAAAELTHADAIHPGIGFLAENEEFAQMAEEHGITFIGPKPSDIALMGNKITAKATAKSLGIPTVPGYDGSDQSDEALQKAAKNVGYPLLIKAAAGGGGRGMELCSQDIEFLEKLHLCRAEAMAAFGNDAVYLENFLQHPKHIEFQILSDGTSCVHLGERDCSTQRRHQKVIEECTAPTIDDKQRKLMGTKLCLAMEKMGYVGAGTLELLYEDGKFYFMEMNTRLQVEHVITEEVYDIDIVREQILIAAGKGLGLKQENLVPNGHAIECRINAEHPETFAPSPGKVRNSLNAGGRGIRVESFIYPGYNIPPYYDSLIAQLVVKANTREMAIQTALNALREYVIEGVDTNIPLLEQLVQTKTFRDGNYSICWLEDFLQARRG